MFKQRVITALILIPLVLLALFKLSDLHFAIVSGLVLLIGGHEWSQMLRLGRCKSVLYLLILTAIGYASLYVNVDLIYCIAMLWWLIACFWLYKYPQGKQLWETKKILGGLIGVLLLIPCWTALNHIRSGPDGIANLFLCLLLVWAADTGAYFAGKKWGKTPFANKISPKKTQEGLYGGLILGLLIAGIYGYYLDLDLIFSPLYGVLVIAVILLSVVGDLVVSMIKRFAGVKDSGKILPGHGGILDRIDSLTAAAPAFAFGLWILA